MQNTIQEIRFLNLFWVRANWFTRLFWLRDKKTGLYIARFPVGSFVEEEPHE